MLGELPSGKSVLQYTLRVAWPSMLESFLVSLVGLIDSLMVSSLGSYAIAAVGLTNHFKYNRRGLCQGYHENGRRGG